VLLADEINRATPKTQSALLQAMEERQVTVFGETYDLDEIFLVLADPEPDRAQGDLPAPRGPARPLHVQAADPVAKPGGARRHRAPQPRRPAEAPALKAVLSRDEVREIRGLIRRIPVTERIPPVRGRLRRRHQPRGAEAAPAPSATSATAPPRAGCSRCWRPRAPRRFSTAASTSPGTICATTTSPPLRHRVDPELRGAVQRVDVDGVLREIFESQRRPS